MTLHTLSIPLAIVVAGGLVAFAVVFSGGGSTPAEYGTPTPGNDQPQGEVRAAEAADHARGDREAPIVVIEYSDFECPFCARLHPTLGRIVEEHADVQWVYRHFPLGSIHQNAVGAAVASECIATLGGNDAFWNFADAAFDAQRSLGDAWYREQAAALGIDTDAFAACSTDEATVAAVQEDFDEARAAGGRGTPFVVIVGPDGTQTSFSGALPYAQVERVIEGVRGS